MNRKLLERREILEFHLVNNKLLREQSFYYQFRKQLCYQKILEFTFANDVTIATTPQLLK